MLLDLAGEFPALAALVERRPGVQRRLPTGRESSPEAAGSLAAAGGPAAVLAESEPAPNGVADDPEASQAPGDAVAIGGSEAAVAPPEPEPPASSAPVAKATLPATAAGAGGARRATRYGLAIDFEDRPESHDLGRLVESTVLVNTAHAAYQRAVASRSEGYHAALTVGMALAAVAVEPAGTQAFLTTFLARWGEALGRDRRRRQPRAVPRP